MQNDNLTTLDDSMLDDVSGGASVGEAIGKLVTDMVADTMGIAAAVVGGAAERRSNVWGRIAAATKLMNP